MNPIPAAKIVIPEEDRKEILARIDEALRTGALTLGKNGKEFEAAFAKIVGAKHAVAVNSGTSSIEIPLRVLGVAGKDVIVPTNTFFATAAGVVHAGGRPVLADVDARTLGLTLESVKKAVTPRTTGVVMVHIAGLVSPETPKIAEFCREKGLFFFEDAAHAHGSSLGGKMAGTFGVAASFSFYPTKVVTSAEGGMIVTDSDDIAQQALQYRDQGKEGFLTNFHVRMGYNWRLSELHAAVGVTQLRRLEEFVRERNRVAAEYQRRLKGVEGLTLLTPPSGSVSNYYKVVGLLDRGLDRASIKKELKEKHAVSLSGEVYDTPLHKQPVFKEYAKGSFPVADDVCARHVCLPVFPGMTDEQIAQVVKGLTEVLASRRVAS
ncbi:MAG: DegT/DnrJ/EryC1/StrS aminotransferase family protein [Elusimicrobia bacterium]|nr:DegT/DnrJ/EryC1/StrS aminotransferase family protein [Elusimicrobiota bacterium]